MGDADAGDTGVQGGEGILQLGDHSTGDGAVGHELLEGGLGDVGN